MNWLEQIAPTVAAAVAGPLAPLAYEVISKIIGSSPDDTKAMLESGKMTAEQLAQVKVAEIELQKQAQELGLNFEQLAVEDRKSARDMQMATHSMWPGVLSAITTFSVLVVIGARMYGAKLPDDPVTIQLIGSLTTGWGMALAYWFGTTRSSSDKNVMLLNANAQGGK